MNKSEYLRLMHQASEKKLRITKQMEREIRETYRNVAKDLERQIVKANPNSLNEKWLHDYRKSLNKEIDSITKSLYKSTKEKMKEVIRVTNEPQLDLFQSINSKYSLGLESTFNSMFSRVNTDVLNEILSGGIYKDNAGLSERLWRNSKYNKKDIQAIVMEGIAGKKSSRDLAKDFQSYLRPDASKTGRQASYNAMRLARTSINHSYQTALKRSSIDNPFITGLQWLSAMQHGRTCELCMERHEKIYKPEEIELDHPNGLCTNIPVIPMSFDEIGETLRSWVDGEHTECTEGINNWMKVNGFSAEDKNKSGNYGNKGYNDNKGTNIKLSNDSDYKDSFFGKFENREVREWYISHDKNIPNLIDRSKPVEVQAREAHRLRNKYRTEARNMMRDQVERAKLDRESPNKSYDELIEYKIKNKKMTKEEAIRDIIKTATKTNKKVNKSLGLE